MKKKLKNAPPVKEKKPEKSSKPEAEIAEPEEAELIKPEPAEPKPEPPLTLIQIAEKQAVFEKEVENTFNKLIERLTPIIQLSDKLAQAQQQQQENPQPQQQGPTAGFNLQSILPFIQMVTGSGGGGDADFKELAKESMKADIAFTKALKAAVISKITGSATSDIARAVSGE